MHFLNVFPHSFSFTPASLPLGILYVYLSTYLSIERLMNQSAFLSVWLSVCLDRQTSQSLWWPCIQESQSLKTCVTVVPVGSSSIFYTTKSQQGEVILPIGASSRITESHEDCLQTMVIQRQGLTQWNQHSSFSTYFLFVQTGSFPPQCFRFVPENSR